MAPERKPVKKFLKPTVVGGGEEPAVKSGRIGYALALGALAMVGVAVYLLPYQSTPVVENVTRSASKVTGQSNPTPEAEIAKASIDRRVPDPAPAKKAKVPTYDEYIKQAKANKWYPVDPVQKLESNILRHKQVLSNAKYKK